MHKYHSKMQMQSMVLKDINKNSLINSRYLFTICKFLDFNNIYKNLKNRVSCKFI